jgi:hypothetical protein
LILGTGGSDDDCCAPPEEAEVPPFAVAVVDGAPEENVPIEDFEPALERAAAIQGIEVPEPGTPEYEPARDQAMAEILNNAWIAGEADELGIAAPTDAEIGARLDETVDQSFSSREQFEKFLIAQAYCTEDELATVEPEQCEGLRAQVSTTLLADAITEDVLGSANPDTEDPAVAEETEAFRADFTEKWTERTICAEEYLNPRCSNSEEGVAPPTAPGPTPGAPGSPGPSVTP